MKTIHTTKAPQAIGPYSQAVVFEELPLNILCEIEVIASLKEEKRGNR